jgi:HAD superfamily hydrolase (TIGR01490 family)
MELALFDLDNTLLDGDSDFEWAQYLIDQGVLERAKYESRNQAFYDQYKAGTLNITEFLEFQLAPLAKYPRAQLDTWHRAFLAERVLPMVKPKARVLVQDFRSRGALCVLVTATNSFVTAPIAKSFGIEHLIATDLEEINGQFTGRPRGTPSFREGKVTRLNEWLSGRNTALGAFSKSWFYSDSANDIPLMEHVTDPIAVDPDERLAETARSRGWAILNLKDE